MMQLCHLRFTNLLNENIIYYPDLKSGILYGDRAEEHKENG